MKKVFDEYFKEIKEAEDKIKKTHNIASWVISLTNIILSYKSNYSSSDASDLTVRL